MRTLNNIITEVNCSYDLAPMGRMDQGTKPSNKRVYDCAVPMNGAYDRGGAYWGFGPQLRVSYTKDLEFISFYRKTN